MAHTEIRREGTHTVVLCIHGILGTPDHFSDFLPFIPEKWGIISLLLKGHGKKVEDFSKSTMSHWKKQVEEELVSLEGKYERILVLAHSMGCLFALDQAIFCEKIQGLFLLAPPMKPRLRFSIVKTSIKLLCGLNRESDVLTQATKKAYSIEISRKLWLYLFWIPNYTSLFREISRIRTQLNRVSQPVWIYFSEKDELVQCSSKEYVQNIPRHKISFLSKSAHFYYEKDDYYHLLEEFNKFITFFQEGSEPCTSNIHYPMALGRFCSNR